ncbi:hypothetical protein [Shewanella frigidimarina]|uniref:hypothetical protein n=1 Tax=Shewanella frigidimarina TaxID=56812 RepID=UPI003FA120ED|tara:strand:+ start:1613 stop:2782 length:1170 start_codon:yes stop_codon:yes gene_type:complete
MKLIIEPIEPDFDNIGFIKICNVIILDHNDKQLSCQKLWVKSVMNDIDSASNDCGMFLIMILMDAMKLSADIIVKGAISKDLIINLMEFQCAWEKWLPKIYKKVKIVADITFWEPMNDLDKYIVPFTGGVDSTFTVFENFSSPSYKRNIERCVFVHGFDIPLKYESQYKSYYNLASSTLDSLNIQLTSISTNFREISMVDWEHCFATALVGVLNIFKGVSAGCLIGSSRPYDNLYFPWGSNPVTDHLLSDKNFKVVHDGSGYTRTEKISFISDWVEGSKNLRVCWEGEYLNRNCGKCEKCLRTQVGFIATGNLIPKSFPKVDVVNLIVLLRLRNKPIYMAWVSLLKSPYLNENEKKIVFSIKKMLLINSLKNSKLIFLLRKLKSYYKLL